MSTLSPKALQLILDYEVGGGQRYYEKRLARPCWPKGQSGVTIGIGYDLGYTPDARFRGDWASLPDGIRDRLGRAIGIKGTAASGAAAKLHDIVIPWEAALTVFQARTIPFWIAQTLKAFPGADKLPPDAFGALVSLVFNRGPALEGKNRQDMKDISLILADGVQVGDLDKIADQLLEMCRIWAGRGLDGLITRRKAEAALVRGAR